MTLFISIAVYCVDTFTAINLLAFDRWAGQIKPEIPLSISRWIFAGCIILSFVLLFYRWMRAIRVMKAGGVAQSYLDPLAVRVQSIRTGEGRGWKRFLVFAELTKSKKGADYVALFAYFSFEAWLRICFAEGPRQVVNGITLYSVMRLNLLPQGQHAATDGHSPVIQFFVNVGILASSNKEQAVILFGMLFTLIIWLISAINLAISAVLYLVFLWHHIPSSDGGLKKYCRRKINRRMARIVKTKVDTALKKENELRARQQAKEGADFKRQPTLPDVGTGASDEFMPPLSRQTTLTTLPEYTSRPQTTRNSDDTLTSLPIGTGPGGRSRPPPPSRGLTHTSEASWSSYSSTAPLVNGAGDMGRSFSEPVQSPRSASPGPWTSRPPPMRSATSFSQQSNRPFSPGPGSTAGAPQGPVTGDSFQMEPLSRTATSLSNASIRGPIVRAPSDSGFLPPMPKGRKSPSSQQNPSFQSVPTPTSATPLHKHSSEDGEEYWSPSSTTNPYFPPNPIPTGRSSPALAVRGPSRGPPSFDHNGGNSPVPSLRGPPRGSPFANTNGRNSPAPSYGSQSRGPPSDSRPPPPMGPSAGRSLTPSARPTLPVLQTSNGPSQSGYIPFSPSAQSTNSSGAGRSFSRPPPSQGRPGTSGGLQSSHSGYPSSGFAPPQSYNRHDSVVDILNDY